jgi:hypothetical protein
LHYYLHCMTVFHYTPLYHIPNPNVSQCDVLQNTRHSIWTSSLCPATTQGVFLTPILLTWSIGWAPINEIKWQMGFNSAFKGLIWSIPVVTFPALSTDERNRYSFMALNAYSQHDTASVSDWCCVAIYCTAVPVI